MAGASGLVLIKDRYLVDLNAPLSELDLPSAKAFAVRDRRDQEEQLFALVATPGLPIRMDGVHKLVGDQITCLLPLVAWDESFWPPLNQNTVILVYRRPLGGKVVDVLESGEFTISEYEIQNTFIEPMMAAIRELDAMSLPHREIRAGNLYFLDKERQTVVLGDCLTCPPGFDQPILYETVERGMCSPAGRGAGDIGLDLYALGVTVLVLYLRERIPDYDNADDLLAVKIQQGTYTALCGKHKIPINLIEPLRGILRDETSERWSQKQMGLWLDGQRQTPMQRKTTLKPDAPYVFMETAYTHPRTLAHAFTQHIKEAAEAIRKPELAAWLGKSIGDKALAEDIKTVVYSPQRDSDPYLVSRVSILMDPHGPIRYKGLSFMPDGFGPMLAVELLRRNSMQIPAEIIDRKIYELWYAATTEKPRDEASVNEEDTFKMLQMHMRINSPGFGIERCLYEMNRHLPCQSPLVAEQYVMNIRDLLPSLDAVADTTDKKLRPLDRHVIAFIAARFPEPIGPHLKVLADGKDASFLIGMLSLMAFLQWRLKGEPVYALGSWVGSQLGPAINTYHSRKTRRQIEQEMPRVVRQGSLPELFDLIDNADKKRKDAEDYELARGEYRQTEEQIKNIETGDLASPEASLERGQKLAALTSVLISMLGITVMIVVEFW